MEFDTQALVVESSPKSPEASVICLHGLGADGYDFEDFVPQLRLQGKRNIRFVFPHAPVQPVTLNMGMRMRAWYDILGLDISTQKTNQDCSGHVNV